MRRQSPLQDNCIIHLLLHAQCSAKNIASTVKGLYTCPQRFFFKVLPGCSTLLVIREMQIKTKKRYHVTPVWMTIIKMNTNNKYDKDFEKGEPLYTVSRNLNWCHPCEKQYGVSQKSKNKTTRKWSESHSVMSDSLQPYGPYIPWNSPGQNTEWVAFPFSRGSSQSGIKPKSPTLHVDS